MIRLALRWTVRVIALLVAGVLVYLAVCGVQVWLTSLQSDPHDASAALVMGSAQYNGTPSPDLQARLNEALSLWRRHYTQLVVVTGGKEPSDVYTESQVGAHYLESHGVPASAIIQADGNDSWANVAQAAPAMRAHQVSTVLVVTDPFHEYRSMAIVSQLGFHPYPSPTQHSPITGWSEVPYFAKEAVAVGLGRIIGYQNLDSLPFGIK